MSDPTPPRRFRFGLRSLFVAVTVAAVLSSFVAWYAQRQPFPITGNIDREDVAAILAIIQSDPDIRDHRVLQMILIAPGKVTVRAGWVESPSVGSGEDITLIKINGIWEVIEYEGWEV